MQYETAFDVTQAGYSSLWFPAFGAIFTAAAVTFAVCRRHLRPRFLQWVPTMGVGFGILWTVLALGAVVVPYVRLSSALTEDRCTVTEGPVTNYHPMQASKHGTESFTVSGVIFECSDYTITPAFHRTRFTGSPIHNGVYVRIYHLGNDIARLQIASNGT